MPGRRPWFLVMRPEQANQPGSNWVRIGAASRGKVAATPVAWEGWATLFGFIALLIVAPLLIWVTGFAGGLTLLPAIVLTAVALAIIVAGFVFVLRTRSAKLPPSGYPPK